MAKKKKVIRLYNYGNGRYEQLNLNLSNSNDANAGNAPRANVESTWDLPFVHSTLSGLPTFPDELFKTDVLPPLFESITQGFVDPRHRDVAFLSTLVFASALFPKVKAQYGSNYHHANLFGMIVAPSSVGKSNIRVGEYLVMPLVEKYREEYLIQYQHYRLNEETMSKPKEKRLIISANSSDSA
ncbi:MAG: DUF3987 domain-containing protein, partial [Bacteroidetes bacterium]|nr:DUF3987 domain-containing protein [Bacteroidota bacterium]